MDADADPIVATWYVRLDKGQEFQVVAVDEAAGLVEIQHFDGNLEELDLDAWYQLDAEPIEPPEDWSGPVDVGEEDDLTGTEVTDTPPEDWLEPLDEIHKPEAPPAAALPAGEDDWGEGVPEEESEGPEARVEPNQEAVVEALERPRPPAAAWSED